MVDEGKIHITETPGTEMPWWKKNVDEMIIGLVIGAIAVSAILFLQGDSGVAVATAAIAGLSVYLGKSKNGDGV